MGGDSQNITLTESPPKLVSLSPNMSKAGSVSYDQLTPNSKDCVDEQFGKSKTRPRLFFKTSKLNKNSSTSTPDVPEQSIMQQQSKLTEGEASKQKISIKVESNSNSQQMKDSKSKDVKDGQEPENMAIQQSQYSVKQSDNQQQRNDDKVENLGGTKDQVLKVKEASSADVQKPLKDENKIQIFETKSADATGQVQLQREGQKGGLDNNEANQDRLDASQGLLHSKQKVKDGEQDINLQKISNSPVQKDKEILIKANDNESQTNSQKNKQGSANIRSKSMQIIEDLRNNRSQGERSESKQKFDKQKQQQQKDAKNNSIPQMKESQKQVSDNNTFKRGQQQQKKQNNQNKESVDKRQDNNSPKEGGNELQVDDWKMQETEQKSPEAKQGPQLKQENTQQNHTHQQEEDQIHKTKDDNYISSAAQMVPKGKDVITNNKPESQPSTLQSKPSTNSTQSNQQKKNPFAKSNPFKQAIPPPKQQETQNKKSFQGQKSAQLQNENTDAQDQNKPQAGKTWNPFGTILFNKKDQEAAKKSVESNRDSNQESLAKAHSIQVSEQNKIISQAQNQIQIQDIANEKQNDKSKQDKVQNLLDNQAKDNSRNIFQRQVSIQDTQQSQGRIPKLNINNSTQQDQGLLGHKRQEVQQIPDFQKRQRQQDSSKLDQQDQARSQINVDCQIEVKIDINYQLKQAFTQEYQRFNAFIEQYQKRTINRSPFVSENLDPPCQDVGAQDTIFIPYDQVFVNVNQILQSPEITTMILKLRFQNISEQEILLQILVECQQYLLQKLQSQDKEHYKNHFESSFQPQIPQPGQFKPVLPQLQTAQQQAIYQHNQQAQYQQANMYNSPLYPNQQWGSQTQPQIQQNSYGQLQFQKPASSLPMQQAQQQVPFNLNNEFYQSHSSNNIQDTPGSFKRSKTQGNQCEKVYLILNDSLTQIFKNQLPQIDYYSQGQQQQQNITYNNVVLIPALNEKRVQLKLPQKFEYESQMLDHIQRQLQ